MPRHTRTVCPTPGCPSVTTGGRCAACRRGAEQARGSARQRGYGTQHQQRFRAGVLCNHPTCVVCHREPSVVADHWPRSRRELVQLGLDPDDPQYGRGLCSPCHSRETARLQPGGWHRP